MQVADMLLSNVMDALPTIGELTSAVARPLERLDPSQLEYSWALLQSFGVGEAMRRFWGLPAAVCLATFFVVLGLLLSRGVNFAKFSLYPLKFEWKGVAGVGCMLGGIALLLLLGPSLIAK
jgi:hypothetical protein